MSRLAMGVLDTFVLYHRSVVGGDMCWRDMNWIETLKVAFSQDVVQEKLDCLSRVTACMHVSS